MLNYFKSVKQLFGEGKIPERVRRKMLDYELKRIDMLIIEKFTPDDAARIASDEMEAFK